MTSRSFTPPAPQPAAAGVHGIARDVVTAAVGVPDTARRSRSRRLRRAAESRGLLRRRTPVMIASRSPEMRARLSRVIARDRRREVLVATDAPAEEFETLAATTPRIVAVIDVHAPDDDGRCYDVRDFNDLTVHVPASRVLVILDDSVSVHVATAAGVRHLLRPSDARPREIRAAVARMAAAASSSP